MCDFGLNKCYILLVIYALGTKEREELKAKYYIIDTKISSIDIKKKGCDNGLCLAYLYETHKLLYG